MPPFASWLKRLALRGDDRRKAVAARYLVDVNKFDLAAEAERMRVDRNNSVVALLAIRLAAGKDSPSEVARLARWMATRLRMTDTCGWLRDGRIGVLLPDASEHGAWTVASDLCDLYPAGADRPDCEVLLYPPKNQRDAQVDTAAVIEPGADDSSVGLDGFVNAAALRDTSAGGGAPATLSTRPAVRPSKEVLAAAAGSASEDEFDRLFVRRMPAWKRAIDVAGASVGLVLAGPVILLAAAAIRATSPGEALFTQEREGLGGKQGQRA